MESPAISSLAIARTAITIAVVAALGLVFIALFYSIGGPFGTLNDVCVALVGIFSGVLAWMLYPTHRFYSRRVSRFALATAMAGACLAAAGSGLVIFKFTSWFLAGLVTTFGYGLIGLWLLALSYSTRRWPTFPRRLAQLGIVAGAVTTIGMLTFPGIFARIDVMGSAPGVAVMSMFVGGIGWNILYPIWCIGAARRLPTSTKL